MKLITFLITIALFILWGCNSGSPTAITSGDSLTPVKSKTPAHDTTILQASFQQADTSYNDYLTAQLAPIRANFKRINSISQWSSTTTRELEEQQKEGKQPFTI